MRCSRQHGRRALTTQPQTERCRFRRETTLSLLAIHAFIAHEFPDSEPYPWNVRSSTGDVLRHIPFAEAMLPFYAALFNDVSTRSSTRSPTRSRSRDARRERLCELIATPLVLTHPFQIDEADDAEHRGDAAAARCLNRDLLRWPASKQWLTSPEVPTTRCRSCRASGPPSGLDRGSAPVVTSDEAGPRGSRVRLSRGVDDVMYLHKIAAHREHFIVVYDQEIDDLAHKLGSRRK